MGKKLKKQGFLPKTYHYLEYLMVRGIGYALLFVGLNNALRIGRFLGWLVSVIDKKHTDRAHKHLDMALGSELSKEELSKIAKRIYSHFGMVIVEMVYTSRLIKNKKFINAVKIEGRENLDEALSKGKGVILSGGHIGNWEVCGCYLAMQGYSLSSIARPLDNQYLDAHLNSIRMQTGQSIFPKWGALKESIKAFRNNGIVAMLVDQDARKYGVFVNFFGIPSSTLPTPATLALKYGAAIVPFYTVRSAEGFNYTLGFEKALEIEPTDSFEHDVVTVTQKIADSLERIIRLYPEQWLWMHRRWKTTPEKLQKKLEKMKMEATDVSS